MRIATLLVVLGGSVLLAPPALALQREPVRKPERPIRERADTGVARPSQSRPTKPKASDLFFVGTTNLERGHLNSKNSAYIVARDIEIAGWLVQPWWKSNPNDPNSGFEVNPHGGEPGAEDIHYFLALDPDFIAARYGSGSVLSNAMLPGHPGNVAFLPRELPLIGQTEDSPADPSQRIGLADRAPEWELARNHRELLPSPAGERFQQRAQRVVRDRARRFPEPRPRALGMVS